MSGLVNAEDFETIYNQGQKAMAKKILDVFKDFDGYDEIYARRLRREVKKLLEEIDGKED